jgi:hypothetical protein
MTEPNRITEPSEASQEPLNSVQTAEVTGHEFNAARAAEANDVRKLPRLPSPHAGRFRVALAMLFGIAIGAIAIAVFVISDHTGKSRASGSQAWSQWSPSTGGSTGAQEIADYVSPFYRLSAAQQLDVVTPISLTSETAAGTTTGKGVTIAIDANGSSNSDSLSLLTGSTVAYNVCGLGASHCELVGTASANRLLLLRREALELGLYTLKYLHSVDNVLVVLPPGHSVAKVGVGVTPAKPVTVAVLFLRDELKPLLSTPIDDELEEDPPDIAELPAWSKSDEAGLVDQVTARTLFSEQVQTQQEGGNLLVLTPIAPQ